MENARKFVRFLFRFKCPNCDCQSFEVKPMQNHLLWCKKGFVEDEIRQELSKATMLSEPQDNDCDKISQKDFDGFDFDVSSPISMAVRLRSVEQNGSDFESSSSEFEDENAQFHTEEIEIADVPKIDKVLSFEQAMEFHENETKVTDELDDDSIPESESNSEVQEYAEDKETMKRPNRAQRKTKITMAKVDTNMTLLPESNSSVMSRKQALDYHEKKAKLCNEIKKKNGRFVCRYNGCGKTFVEKSNVKKHEMIHTGVKPFACGWKNCNKKFLRKQNRDIHVRRHMGVKPYACEWKYCKKKFVTSSDKIKHYRIHTGEKPFICHWKGCGERFAIKQSLRVHKIKIHAA